MKINDKHKILFVCLGNICRSPAAQGVFQSIVQLPDRRMREAAARRGYMLTHKARPVEMTDFLDSDVIVAMDDANYEDLMHLAPSVEDSRKVVKMADYLTTHSISYIPDPYYMGAEGFELVLDLLEEACRNLYNSLSE